MTEKDKIEKRRHSKLEKNKDERETERKLSWRKSVWIEKSILEIGKEVKKKQFLTRKIEKER